MRDSEMVTAIVAGDPAGLAAAYDRYAAALHAYCSSLLTQPEDASDAVQDTFIVAASKLDGLRDPDRLRPWLYAVARNECHRRRRALSRLEGFSDGADVVGGAAEVAIDPEQADLRELVSAAIAALNPAEREIIELNLRQELHGDDLASVLGVPRNQAHALASRARSQFETSLGVLLVARAGRASCAKLDEMLADWDGRLDVLLRKRLSRHVAHCDKCGARRRRELQPAMLLGLLPVAAIPAVLRPQVLELVSSTDPQDATYRETVVRGAEPFDPESGFPAALDVPAKPARPHRRRELAIGATAALALICAGVIELTTHHHGPSPRASSVALGGTPTAAPQAALAVPGGSVTNGKKHGSKPSGPGPALNVFPRFSPSGSLSLLPTSPGGGGSPTRTAQPKPSTSRPSSPPPPPVGTLNSSTSAVTLTTPAGSTTAVGSFTLTASGGAVSYTISVPSAAPGLSVSPASGTLASGGSVTIDVSWTASPPGSSAVLTIDPGGFSVSIGT